MRTALRSGSENLNRFDKCNTAKTFIDALTDMKVIPHVAQNTSGRRSAVPDERRQYGGLAGC